MNDAPERIWAVGMCDNEPGNWTGGHWDLHQDFSGDVEYLRADLVRRVVRLPQVPEDDEAELIFGEGVTYATQIVAEGLGIHPDEFSWDAATEEFEGDVRAVVGNMLSVINPEGGTLRERIEALEAERDRAVSVLIEHTVKPLQTALAAERETVKRLVGLLWRAGEELRTAGSVYDPSLRADIDDALASVQAGEVTE